jgi:hypothetical protein
MSAFLMSAEDLAAIAREIARTTDNAVDAEMVFGLLLDENLKSVGYRYPDATRISDWCEGEGAYTFEMIPEASHTATELDEMVRSYQYQSCEHPEWQESTAYKATTLLRALLESRVKAEAQAEWDKVNARRAALAKLPSLSEKDSAKQIRKILKAQFPATKFSVRSDSSSVDIRWTDGPTTKAVDSFVQCFKAGRFDGMTDSYDYDRDSVLMIDGQQYTPDAQYVFTHREISADLANRCIQQVAEYWGATEIPTAIATQWGGYTLNGFANARPKPELPFYWTDYIHQAAQDRSRFLR